MKRIAKILIVLFVLSFTVCAKNIGEQNLSRLDISEPEPAPQLVSSKNIIVPNGLNEEHSIEYYFFDTGVSGPGIVIISGVHGNEPASIQAATRIIENFANPGFEFSRGRFLIIPKANPTAAAMGTRATLGLPDSNATDLNRHFPGNENGTETQRVAAALTKILDDFKPDVVIDLHEAIMGNDWSSTGGMPNSIFFTNPSGNARGTEAANFVLEAINKTELVKNARDFRARRSGMAGLTSTEFGKRFNIPAFLIETGRPLRDDANPINTRIEQHLFLVNELVKFFSND